MESNPSELRQPSITFQKEGQQTRVYFTEEGGVMYMDVVLFKRGEAGLERAASQRYVYTPEFEQLLRNIAAEVMGLQ
jgi:hypothetical protein